MISFESFLIKLATKEGQKANPCHSPNSGQFCSTSSGGGSFVPGDADALNAHYALDKNCPPIDCESIKIYAGSGYKGVNTALRKGTYDQGWSKAEVDKLQNGLDKSFRDAPLVPKDIIVYRGMSPKRAEGLKPGDLFTDKGFISTTISPKHSYRGIQTEIRVPKGTKGIYIEKASNFPKERELLLNRGLSLRVISKEGDKLILEVEG